MVGDGKVEYVLARVDLCLLHGQATTAWAGIVQPNCIIVASDAASEDGLRKRLIKQAIPPDVKVNAIPISKMIEIAENPCFGNTKILLLLENPEDVLTTVEGGTDIKELSVGPMTHSVGEVVINKASSMGQENVRAFEKPERKGVKFDVRKASNDPRDNMDDVLKGAKAELART